MNTIVRNFIVCFILKIFYLLFLPLKVKRNQIVFISYKGDKLEADFRLLSEALEQKRNYQLRYVLIRYENNLLGNIKYLINCLIQAYYMCTSKIVLLDYNNYVASTIHKKGVCVIQLWHASGAVKKFGNDVTRQYRIKNYDYVISTSDVWKGPYSSAFNVQESQVISLGLPRNDCLNCMQTVNNYRNQVLKKYPKMKGKKIILYAPTFRGNFFTGISYEKIDLDFIQKGLGNDYVIIYKLHPLLKDEKLSENDFIINGNKDSIFKLMAAADYLITDYSSILFDYSILRRPIIGYVPDLKKYSLEVGTYMDYVQTMPFPSCYTEEAVVNTIMENHFDLDRIEAFNQVYFKYHDSNSTQRIMSFIDQIIQG